MRKKIFGGLIGLTLALAPVAAANADYPPAPVNHGSLDKYIADPGEVVTYTAPESTYDAAENLSVKLRGIDGHTMTLASFKTLEPGHTESAHQTTAADDGSHTFAFTIPDTGDGHYELDIYKATGELFEYFEVKVANPTSNTEPPVDPGNPDGNGDNAGGVGNGSGTDTAGKSNNGGGLAMTGSDIAVTTIGGAAALLVIGGITLMIVRRRRSSADKATA